MMNIIPLSEGSFTVDASKKFIPFHPSDSLTDRTRGSLLVEIQPFIVITKNEIILMDTGLGFTDPHDNLQLHNNLIKEGINPLDVTQVLMSHLHKDHSGGISKKDVFSGQRRLSFPNAKYVINRNEWETALHSTTSSYIPEYIQPLINSDQLMLIEGEGRIGENVRFAMTGGHSPCHQVFWIEEENEIVFFGGDVAPQLVQMKTKFVAKYDYDGKLAASLRNHWAEEGKQHSWIFLFYHDINNPVCKF
jgi:glyoxylase-like metal-dependent hydrolase (beta-lactamase superfamily II)